MRAIRTAVCKTRLAVVYRNNVGFDVQRKMKFGLGIGSADLVGMLIGGWNAGRVLAYEVKTPEGRLSKEQIAWIQAVNKRGGFAYCVRSVDEALEKLKEAHERKNY